MKNGDLAWVQGEAGHNDALTGKTPVTFASGVRCWFKSEELTPAEGMVVVDARELEALRTIAQGRVGIWVGDERAFSSYAHCAERLRWSAKEVYYCEPERTAVMALADAYATLAALEKERGA